MTVNMNAATLTLRELLGSVICRVKGKHLYKRRKRFAAGTLMTVTFSDPAAYDDVRICGRCGHTVPVRKRKPKAAGDAA